MSRGLGRFQRNIKAMIYGVDAWWREECAKAEAEEREPADGYRYWVLWPEIKATVKDDLGLSPEDKLPPSLERSLKRALHSLVKRGEIGKMPDLPPGSLAHYITKECYDESFSPKALRQLKEAMSRMGR
jgi:hypothetical protein